ncbi:MAG: glycine--tRNA ligase [bacterium]|nr:glycine--tRNA ligase [bacterium]
MKKNSTVANTDLMQNITSLAKRRGFIFAGSDIYGGLANSWDYGPLGVELKNNIKQEWWRRFVQQRADVVGIDAALLMNPKVWEASGHLASFTDPLVECKTCHARLREDQLIDRTCLNCKGKDFTPTRQFNMMLKTYLGPSEESANTVYFRPETAQAMFVNFKNILDTNRPKLPFGIAQQGKAFRNEITPGNFVFRMREFEQMEIEYFVKEREWEKYFEHWLGEMKQWLKDLGVSEKKLHYVDIPDGERAHYSKRTVDIEYEYPFGQKELYGLAYRGDFDLKNHMQASGQDLRYTDTETQEKFLPHVIEPTWGVDRSVLVAMLEAYHEEDAPTAEEGESAKRVVMKFPAWLAPVKVAILPLSKKEELSKVAKPIFETLSKQFVCEYDETQSIGKRYRRQDEIGTPLCITVDFETLQDNAVTIRDRDTMKQERILVKDLAGEATKRLHV